MRRFQTDDARLLEFPPSHVFRRLSDFEDYNRWWPREVRFRMTSQFATYRTAATGSQPQPSRPRLT